ncbi:cation channel sperm-associated protein 2-like [Lineus longissimus]|uniref:cation channel sperm-associated protein 2-like n=1 Tax=Lineus longissimus TaxID=88925 RepID=UPI00315CB5E1
MWANWVLESGWFQNIMLTVILGNSLLLGIQAELNEVRDESLEGLNTVLDIFDYFSLFVFVLEIVLKWMDNFKLFWLNGWNIFDFLVTFLSVVPEVMRFTDTDGSSSAGQVDITVINNLRGFRILRSLKMVTRFRQVRLIALSVAKAFKAMLFIILLLATFVYIMAVAGVIFFDSYSHSQRPGLMFNYNFRTLPSAFACLFQLLTLDRWHDILLEMMQVVDPFGSIFYIIFWVLMGSFVFRNIFVGIMVNNFQSIRADLFHEVMEIQEMKEQTLKIEKLNEELMKQEQNFSRGKGADGEELEEEDEQIQKTWSKDDASKINSKFNLAPANLLTPNLTVPSTSRRLSTISAVPAGSKRVMTSSLTQPHMSQYQKDVSQILIQATESCTDWQKTVSDNLETISKNPIDTAWPKDTLFRYLLLMEALQENLAERSSLMALVGQALLHVFDN